MLTVFVSSVSDELDAERKALREEVQALGALFSGMEYFGSKPESPAPYCARKAAEPDLYVGLLGMRYGSVDPGSGLSFTHLEYQAARNAAVPCLVYLKGRRDDGVTGDPAIRAFKAQVQKDVIVSWFTTPAELRVCFLRDFVKLLRERFLDRVAPLTPPAIPAGALHALTQGMLPERIRAVAGDKYRRELYVAPGAETPLLEFAEHEEAYLRGAGAVLDALAEISLRYGLAAELRVDAARAVITRQIGPDVTNEAISGLRQAFHADEIESLRRDVEALVRERGFGLQGKIDRLAGRLRESPFIARSALPGLPDRLAELVRRSSVGGLDTSSTEYRRLLSIFPSTQQDDTVQLASDLLRDLQLLSDQNARRCAVVIARAGTGKSNLLCSLAEQLSSRHPVLLIGGQSIRLREHGIERYVQELLEQQFQGVFSDWLNRVSPGLQRTGQWLFILIDGINESDDIRATADMLREFLSRLPRARVKVVLSCRDLLWERYTETVRPHAPLMVRMHGFSDARWDAVLARYFSHFGVRGTIEGQAREMLRNPLLLRLFCEVNRGTSVGRVGELRTIAIFEAYFADARRRIADRLQHVNARVIETFLLRMAWELWARRISAVPLSVLGISEEASRTDSVYTQLIDENVVREEQPVAGSMETAVRFVYDELFEYMLACAWRSTTRDTDRLVKEVIAARDGFPAAFNALLYLDSLSDDAGSLVNELLRLLGRTPEPFAAAGQVRMLYAFERLDLDALDDELIALLARFEEAALPDVKQRLAKVILRVGARMPTHPTVRSLVEWVLEIHPRDGAAAETAARNRADRERLRGWLKNKPEPEHAPAGESTLPPGRFHYTESTRLNAIALLAGVIAPDDPQRIAGAITALGRTDLHSALEAIVSLDQSTDRVVYPLIESYMGSGVAEYQIYCAWLLRERYGPEPAGFLLRLTTTMKTRVHRFTMRILDTRKVEAELLDGALDLLTRGRSWLRPWHVHNLLQIAGRPDRFRAPAMVNSHHEAVLSALPPYYDHPRGSVRLDAFRAAVQYRPYLDLERFRRTLAGDEDVYVRRLARTLESSGFFAPA
ncbi:DUF4062 domain-containing protein [Longimicrobium sp.]|uniref:DUF4062 domain-containing protein n=1 Tax=Longimicrobium sp. TaxID=2029185 RepID=UPI002E33FB80|nr:DUF4062 domain-containing protein [Longimicrobium sp.]HEX6039848.1 DUF4062 domain-containing protein [Longimicrobium sp.]